MPLPSPTAVESLVPADALCAPEPLFDELLLLARQTLAVPTLAVTLTDGVRHWLQAQAGAPISLAEPLMRDAHAQPGTELWPVPAACLGSLRPAAPAGAGLPTMAWGVAAPLLAPGGECLGALWLLDSETHALGPDQVRAVQGLARIASRAQWLRCQAQASSLPALPMQSTVSAEGAQLVSQIADRVPMRMAYVDRSGRYRYANQSHCRRLGRPREAVIGHLRSEFVDVSADETASVHARAALGGELQRFQLDEVIDGQTRRLECLMIPDVDGQGQVRGLFATAVDITERSATEQRLRDLVAVLDHTPDFVVQADKRGHISYMNPAVRRAVGMSLDEPVSRRHVAEFNTPATNALYLHSIVPTAMAQGVWVGETTVYMAGHREVPINHMVIAHRDPSGRVERFSAVMRDISAEVQTRQQEQRQSATLRSVTESIPAMVSVVGNDHRYRLVNSSFENWYATRRTSLVGQHLVDVMGAAEYAHRRPYIERVLAGETVNFERDFADGDKSRHVSVSYIPLRLADGSIDGLVSVAHDITAHKQETGRLRHLSQRDSLTGLLNRAGFDLYLEQQRDTNATASVAMLYIDLDHFKPINDAHGHAVGDQVLKRFAQRLQKLVRPSDAVARLGGDEFIVVLAGVGDAAPARGVADKVVAAAAAPFKVGELRLNVGASVGVALGTMCSPGGGDELLRRADAMLYRAKQAGRGRHAGDYEPELPA